MINYWQNHLNMEKLINQFLKKYEQGGFTQSGTGESHGGDDDVLSITSYPQCNAYQIQWCKVGTKVKPQANREASMKVRIIDHVNHVRYKDIDVKNMKQAQEMMEDNNSWLGPTGFKNKAIGVSRNTTEIPCQKTIVNNRRNRKYRKNNKE